MSIRSLHFHAFCMSSCPLYLHAFCMAIRSLNFHVFCMFTRSSIQILPTKTIALQLISIKNFRYVR
jgi:hypothetical protein